MLFNSLIFIAFALAFYALWPMMRKGNALRWAFITAASFFFYGWWDWRLVFLLLASGALNYAAGLAIAGAGPRKKAALAAGVAANLLLLGAFKYVSFVLLNVNFLLRAAGSSAQLAFEAPPLPIGISFYTFMGISYLADIYKGQISPTRSLLHFLSYISMFPHLIAGPIVRGAHLLPQLTTWNRTTEEQRWQGTMLIVTGMFKKVVIADNISRFLDLAFEFGGPATLHSMPFWWIAMTVFSFQIYCDFSGYSDIARGLAKWMGYDFPLNFNHPYIANSFRDFWARWHMSLSTWFRDYVYIPLGGGRRGKMRWHINMWITMVLSGLWHGAAWTFVAWGAAHALYLSVERLTKWPERLGRLPAGRWIVSALLIPQIWIAWVFFRAPDMGTALAIIKQMADITALSLAPVFVVGVRPLVFLAVGVAMEMYFYLGIDRSRFADSRAFRAAEFILAAIMILCCVYFRGPGAAFIYFQF
jgi:D-alanyl-lipoteichoic acid acyltransferase DltB (MBOAT superfamily)